MKRLPPPYPLIKAGLTSGSIVPFLGAGASLSGRKATTKWSKPSAKCPPSARELMDYLATKVSLPKRERTDLTKVSQYFDLVGGRPRLNDELRKVFNYSFRPTQLHRMLADISAPMLIVTTNYDDLLERAFNAAGRPYDLIIHTTDPGMGNHVLWWEHGSTSPQKVIPNSFYIDLDRRSIIYKMHGTIDRVNPDLDQYVITEDDYADFLSRMMSRKAIPSIIGDEFQRRPFLFLGYSLSDWNLRVVLSSIRKNARGVPNTSWAIQRSPKIIEQHFWDHRGVHVYDMALNDFVKRLKAT